MLIIQRPEIEAAEAEGQRPKLHDFPARTRFRAHTRQQLAAHAAVVDSRRGRHAGAVRRRAPRVRRHQGCEGRRHRRHPQPEGPRAPLLVRGSGHAAPRQARTGRGARQRHPDHVRCRGPQPRSLHLHRERRGPYRPRPHRRAGPGLLVGGAQQAHHDDRCHPRRRDLLAGAARLVFDRADPCGAGDQLRQAVVGDRDRRFDHAPRRVGIGGRHAAQARRPSSPNFPSSRVGWSSAKWRRRRRRRPISTSRSKSSTFRSGRATASSGRASTRSASSCRSRKTISWRSRTSVRSRWKRSFRSSTSAAFRCASRSSEMPAPKRASGSARAPRTRS